ncbi:hypothetical protein QKU48_gp1250 [Fadolivirus algeromassiliense]|jgi:hypothetical protein|uniref:Uncharacterized protein n=1 Tax=Fadolivirus FV1/VV64 TaxID=3070911 RepID=A0A7D3UQU0_9VIRU|nr:hypothetical protein QKU48_gp1250 [Fadolivirus algeromassiliense]QKF94708.1 hypothetical protein Fadolivirus_1_1250 [Fadolivirus FV1/VV64]
MNQQNECQNTFFYCRKLKESNEWQCKNNKDIPYEFRKSNHKLVDKKIIYTECNNGTNFEELIKNQLGSNTIFFDQNYRCSGKDCLWKRF